MHFLKLQPCSSCSPHSHLASRYSASLHLVKLHLAEIQTRPLPRFHRALPVTRVILYKNGVGYFEHAGQVRGSQDVNVDFTTAQLNDVLKSLTVLDLGKGRIIGVSYNSNAPLERRLGSLHLPVGENPTTAQFLDALRGARLEVRSGECTVDLKAPPAACSASTSARFPSRRSEDYRRSDFHRQRQRRSPRLRSHAFYKRARGREGC